MEIRSSVTPRSLRRLHWMLIPGSLALDTVLGLLPRLLKQSTLASIQWTWDQLLYTQLVL